MSIFNPDNMEEQGFQALMEEVFYPHQIYKQHMKKGVGEARL